MSTHHFNGVASVLLLVAFCLVSQQAHAFEWQNLWSTPEQRASRQLDSEQFDELIEQAPNANWRGVGEYRKGDYTAAAESFSQQRETAVLAGAAKATEQAMYNQANALTLNENYPEAISLFDELLELNPDHANASHNRTIAEQLLEQQQQEQDQQSSDDEKQDGEPEEGENGEQSSSDQQEGDQQEGDQQQSDENKNGQSSDQNAEPADGSAEQQEQAEQDAQAARAMQAEQAEDGEPEGADNEATDEAVPTGSEVAPDQLTEKEQANEQWLRKIPDDPAGLLQRKLQNRHLTDFPKVEDSVNPW